MKSILRYFLLAIIATTLIPLSSCKKGANDPFLSFRSRSSRFAGEWKLSIANYTITKVVTNGTTISTTTDLYEYDGTKMKQTNTIKIGNSAPIINTINYTYGEKWTIEKANIYTAIINVDYGAPFLPQSKTIKGNWAWLHKDKDADLKNKEGVVIMPEVYSGSAAGSNGKTDDPRVMILDELKNKEMIEKIDMKSDDGNGKNNGVVTTMTGTRTYVQ